MLLKTLLLVHLFACGWYLVSNIEGSDENWLIKFGISDSSLFTKYVSSLYWTVATMMTIGYGDITASNSFERIFSIITMVVGSGIFSYSINKMGEIITRLNEDKSKIKEHLRDIKEYMHKKKFNKELKLKINKYLEYRYIEETSKEEEIFEIHVEKLSNSLKNEFLFELFGKKINSVPLFKLNFSKELIYAMGHIIKKKQIGENEKVFQVFNLFRCKYFLERILR